MRFLPSSNITYNRFDGTSLAGLNGVLLTSPDGRSLYRTFGEDDPLEVRNFRDTFSASASFSRRIGEFQLTATSNLVFNASTTEIDQRVDVQGIVDLAANGSLELEERLPVQIQEPLMCRPLKLLQRQTRLRFVGAQFFYPLEN